MCGISGAWQPGGFPESALREALQVIRHRGPDGEGIFQNGDVSMGICRLAIIDLEGGDQPIFNEDNTIAVVFNGEIYNYRELTAFLQARGHQFRTLSDTEVLVHLYEDYGTEMCQHLRGMFAFAIYDTRQQKLFLARDRFGKKPLYYTCTRAGGFIFASELKALRSLAASLEEKWSIRLQSIYDYLSLTVIPQPDTIYEDVFALPAASWMCFDGQQTHIQSYWSLDYQPEQSIPYPEALEQTRAFIGEAVRLRLRSDVPIGVFLSGGVDSSIIAYEAAQHSSSPLQTFTIGMEDKFYDESDVAQRTAKSLGIQNTVLRLKVAPLDTLLRVVHQYDQPYADSSAIPSMEVARLARQHVKVVLNGDGGDEHFAGYRRYIAARLYDRLPPMPRFMTQAGASILTRLPVPRRSLPGYLSRFVHGLAHDPATRYLLWTSGTFYETDKRTIWMKSPQRPTETLLQQAFQPGLSNLDTCVDLDVRYGFASDLLVKMDIATMAASLEARSPLTDHLVAEFAARLPNHYHIRGLRTKSLLKDAYRNRIPDEVLDAPKRGFEVPLASWLENELRPLVMDTLGTSTAQIRQYINGSFIDHLLDHPENRVHNRAYTIYMLLVLELWLQKSA